MRLIDVDVLIKLVENSLIDNPHKDAKIKSNHNTEHMHFLSLIGSQPVVEIIEIENAYDKARLNNSIPRDLIKILEKLDDNENYKIMCHSSMKNKVKSWDLPYKIISNNWTDSIFKADNQGMIYIIPDYDKPISMTRELDYEFK